MGEGAATGLLSPVRRAAAAEIRGALELHLAASRVRVHTPFCRPVYAPEAILSRNEEITVLDLVCNRRTDMRCRE